ncbi:ubiquitin_hydrolase_-_putative [Leishmania infantum]|uniref:Ubiquitin_hydrolase_-_putative n=2 Tax=Leishmania infantum TaxID=5671 RepID=A0A6L0XRW6_LEIIN|nr:ubiquitin_hydrolase_-_putative [Leishmania infantum]SUZ46071.1 ubiquitin_hydrolase_-_putative [Leishmania infantum]
MSDTTGNPFLRSQQQGSKSVMQGRRRLRAKSSTVRASVQRASRKPSAADATAAASTVAPAPPVLALRKFGSAKKAARDADGNTTPKANGLHGYNQRSLGASHGDVYSFNTSLEHRTLTATNRRAELPNVFGTDSPSAAPVSTLDDSHVCPDSTATKGPLTGASETSSCDALSFGVNGGSDVFNSYPLRPLRGPRRGAGSRSAESDSAAAKESLCSRTGGAAFENAGAEQRGARGGSLLAYSSDAATQNKTTPPPRARLNRPSKRSYPPSTPAAKGVHPRNVSENLGGTIRATAMINSADSSNVLASPPLSVSHSRNTGSDDDAASITSARQTVREPDEAGAARALLVVPELSPSNGSTPPHQRLSLVSGSLPSPSQEGMTTVAEKKSTESVDSFSDKGLFSSRALRLEPQAPSMQLSGSAEVTKASSSSTPIRSSASTTVKTVSALSIARLHAAPIPLRNFGATCYLNSVVQCLLCTPGLLRTLNIERQRIVREWEGRRRFEEKRKPDDAQRRSCAEHKAPATSSLIDLGTARPAHHIAVQQLLLSLKAACAECNNEFSSNGQKDAHEFLITLLGVIDKEVCRSKPGNQETFKDFEDEKKSDVYARWVSWMQQENDSTVYDFFGGITGCTVKCSSCELTSYRFEVLLHISLPISYRSRSQGGGTDIRLPVGELDGKAKPKGVAAVDELLREMFFSERGESLNGPMQVTCDRCKQLRDKRIWYSMEYWPPILVLHLKRFNNAGVKNETAVVFPYTFHPHRYVKYQLYGVCCHRGTCSSGHYTAYTYVQEDDKKAVVRKKAPTVAAFSDFYNPSLKGTQSDRIFSPQKLPRRGGVGIFGWFDGVSIGNGDNNARASSEALSHKGNGRADGKDRARSAGRTAKAGKWYLCNDKNITEVSAPDVLSMTKEAYILFYRRVDDGDVMVI